MKIKEVLKDDLEYTLTYFITTTFTITVKHAFFFSPQMESIWLVAIGNTQLYFSPTLPENTEAIKALTPSRPTPTSL